MSAKKLLVPHDFSDVADVAVNHAIKTAEIAGAEILLLHVVAKEKDLADAKKQLEAKVNHFEEITNETITFTSHARIGNIFDDIGDFASEHSVEIIFMGTHGASGWQKIAGSHAMKVITHSKVPFIVVQNKEVRPNGYDDIVVPLDLNKETKQKLTMVANMAKYFESRVHIITPDESDEFLKRKVQGNIQFAKKYLTERGIEITTKVAPSSGFDKEIVHHATSLDADLITIMNIQKNSLLGLFSHNYEQYMITNDAQIPVMIINPVSTSSSSGILSNLAGI